jgi:hypothetical protein
MYLGDDVVMYVVLCSLATVGLMVFALLNLYDTNTYVQKLRTAGGVEVTNLRDSQKFHAFAGVVAIAGTVLSILVTSIYYNNVSQKNFKNQLMMSTVAVFGGWVIVDIAANYRVFESILGTGLNWGYFTVRAGVTAVGGGDQMPKPPKMPADSSLRSRAEIAVFAFAHVAIAAYLTMAVVCMWVDFASGTQPWSQLRYLLTFSIAGLLIIQFLQLGLVYKYNVTSSGRLLAVTDANGTVLSTAAPLKLDSDSIKLGSSLKPLQFGPTGDKLFDASVPEHRFLLEIERKVRTDGAKYGLSLKNYAVLQVGDENRYLVLTKEDANSIARLDPVAHITRAKYGLLGFADSNTPLLQDETMKQALIARRVVRETPLAVFYKHNVMGFGVGNGTWIALPYWFNWLIFMMDLAVGCFVYRDAGVSVAIAFITTLPALFIGLLGPENGTFQLLAYNKVFGWGVIVLAYYILPTGMKYVMASTIMEQKTYTWLQYYTNYANQAEDVATAVFTWVFFANVAAYMAMCMAQIVGVADFQAKKTP